MVKIFSFAPEEKATQCLNIYIAEKGWKSMGDIVIDAQDIYDCVFYPVCEFRLINDANLGYENGEKILGKTIITDKLILIDSSISPHTNDRRYPMTLAHEMGHAFLHTERDLYLQYIPSKHHINEMEHDLNELHADSFAETLIAHPDLLRYRFDQQYKTCNIFSYNGPDFYFINEGKEHIPTLKDFSLRLAKPLTKYFSNIPVETMAEILQNFCFIIDKTVKPKQRCMGEYMNQDWKSKAMFKNVK